MKRVFGIFSIVLALVLLSTGSTFAQGGRPGMKAPSDSMPGMMQGRMMQGGMMGQGMMQMMRGMHRQMMRSPMHRMNMTAFMLPALADTLGLSDEQTAQLEELRGTLETQREEMRQEMMANRNEMMSLFEDGQEPSADAVREHLTTMAELRANHQATMYATAQKMRQVLTKEQRATLDSMTPHQQLGQMMSRMPLRDMMQMMRSMQGGMMGPGMMNQMQNMPMEPGMHRQMMQEGGMQGQQKR